MHENPCHGPSRIWPLNLLTTQQSNSHRALLFPSLIPDICIDLAKSTVGIKCTRITYYSDDSLEGEHITHALSSLS